jgi:hypothetical protein
VINQHSIAFREATPCDTICKVQKENLFLSSLSSVNGFYFKDGTTLILVNNGQPVMAFNRRKLIQEAAHAGTR